MTDDTIRQVVRGLTDTQLEALKRALTAQTDYEGWVKKHYPEAVKSEFAQRHHRLWKWFEAIKPGVRQRPLIEIWPRGGAKSSTAEMAVTYLASRRTRKFVLIVSGTQKQADQRVATIGTKMESIGMEAAVNEAGRAKAWRRQQLQAKSITVAAYGLDTAIRGIKVEDYRPDLIIFDDIDAVDDTLETTKKKEDQITSSVIPAGSSDCIILILQNLILETGVVSRLVNGEADFLADAEIPGVEVAIKDLVLERRFNYEFGKNMWTIVRGEATWEGQNLATCQQQIWAWGKEAFMREAQQEVASLGGSVFNVELFKQNWSRQVLKALPNVPMNQVYVFDLAATENDGDYFSRLEMHRDAKGQIYIRRGKKHQWGSDKVRYAIYRESVNFLYKYPLGKIVLPQDPGQAGKDQKRQLRHMLVSCDVKFIYATTKKWIKSRGAAAEFNLLNVFLIEDPRDEPWIPAFLAVLRKFREGVKNQDDDWVDNFSDGFNTLTLMREETVTGGMTVNREVAAGLGRGAGKVPRPWFAGPEEEMSDEDWMAQFPPVSTCDMIQAGGEM